MDDEARYGLSGRMTALTPEKCEAIYEAALAVIADIGMTVWHAEARDLLEEGAVIVYEHASASKAVWPADVTALASKRYGSTTVDIASYERGAGST